MGRILSEIFKSVEHDLEAAYLKIHAEVYFSIVGFLSIVSCMVPLAFLTYVVMGFLDGGAP